VATGSDVNGSWNRGALQFFYDGTYGFGTSGPDNNGNVLKSKHYVPLDDSSNTWAIHDQVYTYDSLNRLTSIAEHFVSSTQSQTQTALQTYTYDRWGNRNINAAQTWGTGINNKVFDLGPAATTNRLGVPVGQSGVMSYDQAGNLTTDTYTGAGTRTYDAENKMTAAQDSSGGTSYYTYNADGQRTRRKINNQETWQIYGIDGELLAEYQANGVAGSPQKEYGYRNGQFLVIAESARTNVALAANGASATASSQYSANYPVSSTINGDRRGLNWNNGGGWNDAEPVNTFPDWVQIDFNGSKTIDEINVVTLQDNPATPVEPTESTTFSLYGLTSYTVQYWNGSTWVTVSGGNVSGNNKVWRKFTFSPITTSKIRVLTNASVDGYSRVTEIEAFAPSGSVKWLIADHLGTPRMVIDQTGSLANMKRHDYLPFGEELFAGTGGRTTALGYAGDGVRQQFTSKERDSETGLDYFLARYYSGTQGRFSSVDPEGAGANPDDPQSWNGYAYARSNPMLFTDPDGRKYLVCDPDGKNCTTVSDQEFYDERRALEKTGNKYTGNRDFYESGEIQNADGGVVATYVQISIDDLDKQYIFAIRGAVDPIPMATAQFFGISLVAGVTGGTAVYALGPSAATTTLGLGGAAAAKSAPSHVRRVLNHIKSSNGSPPPGYRGGRTFKNDARGGGQSLPKADANGRQITYREYDVHPHQQELIEGQSGSLEVVTAVPTTLMTTTKPLQRSSDEP
jgi:RHS repeat-associated protein